MAKAEVVATFGQFPLSVDIRKYSKYEVINGPLSDDTSSNRYIIPIKGSKLEPSFDLFDKYEDFMRDLLSIIDIKNGNDYNNVLLDDVTNQQSVDADTELAILNFANKYGLFGFKKMAIEPLSKILKRAPTEDDVRNLMFFENYYYPKVTVQDKHLLMNRQDNLADEEYGEPITEIFNFIKEIYRFVNNWTNYRSKLKSVFNSPYGELTPLIGNTWGDYFSRFRAENINIGFDNKDNLLKLKLDDMELFEVIKLMVVINCTTKGQKLRICRYCKNPFFAERHNVAFCGENSLTSKAEDDTNSCYNRAKKESRRVKDKLAKGRKKEEILDEFQNEGSPFVTMELINEIEVEKGGKKK